MLIEQKNELEVGIESSTELAVSAQAEESKAGLLQFQGEIENSKREKMEMLAKKANAEARLNIQETLDGSPRMRTSRHSRTCVSPSRRRPPRRMWARAKGESLDDSSRRSSPRLPTPRRAPSRRDEEADGRQEGGRCPAAA